MAGLVRQGISLLSRLAPESIIHHSETFSRGLGFQGPLLGNLRSGTNCFHTSSVLLGGSLTVGLRKKGGRNRHGHKTVGRQGGGHKQKYRIIDFKRLSYSTPGKVQEKVLKIEYDPCRSARIALVAGRVRKYIIAPDGLDTGHVVTAELGKPEKLQLQRGNAYQLKYIPIGQEVHNIELNPGKGGQIVRAAGTLAKVQRKTEDKATIKLPSGNLKEVRLNCMATLGRVSNIDHGNRVLGKAGRSRWLGIKPKPNKQRKAHKKKLAV